MFSSKVSITLFLLVVLLFVCVVLGETTATTTTEADTLQRRRPPGTPSAKATSSAQTLESGEVDTLGKRRPPSPSKPDGKGAQTLEEAADTLRRVRPPPGFSDNAPKGAYTLEEPVKLEIIEGETLGKRRPPGGPSSHPDSVHAQTLESDEVDTLGKRRPPSPSKPNGSAPSADDAKRAQTLEEGDVKITVEEDEEADTLRRVRPPPSFGDNSPKGAYTLQVLPIYSLSGSRRRKIRPVAPLPLLLPAKTLQRGGKTRAPIFDLIADSSLIKLISGKTLSADGLRKTRPPRGGWSYNTLQNRSYFKAFYYYPFRGYSI